jgi:hypothetical protein
MTEVFVNTPRGRKRHGEIVLAGDKKIFVRFVDWDKDRMRIFDAWSINPEAYRKIRNYGVWGLLYRDKKHNTNYSLTTEDLGKMLGGEITKDSGAKFAWEGEFGGGKTIYIKVEAFTKELLI